MFWRSGKVSYGNAGIGNAGIGNAGIGGEAELVVLVSETEARLRLRLRSSERVAGEGASRTYLGVEGERDRALSTLAILETLVRRSGQSRLGALMIETGVESDALLARLSDLASAGLVEAGCRGRLFAPTARGIEALAAIIGREGVDAAWTSPTGCALANASANAPGGAPGDVS